MVVAGRRPRAGLRSPLAAVLLGVFALAFVARLLVPLLSSGGLRGLYDYDPSVYYSAANAIVGGHVPYRDFNLVHPPLLPLVLTPFAVIGRLTTDHTGFVLANLAFTVLGAVNAVLAALLARALGLGLRAAGAAGVFYALWFGSVNAEFTVRLEPLGNTMFLLGMLALCRAQRTSSSRAAMLAGGLLGLAVTVKIWWALPLIVVLGELAWRRVRRQLVRVAAGALAAIVIVCLPFAVLAGSRMWRMVVSAQGGRARLHGSIGHRVSGIATVLPDNWHDSPVAIAVGAVVLALMAVVAAVSWRFQPARLFVVLIAGQVLVLLVSPSYYAFYDDWLAVGGAIMVGAATESIALPRMRLAGSAAVSLLLVGTAVVTAVGLVRQKGTLIGSFGSTTQLVRVAARYPCMTSDSPMLLIEADALTRSLAGSCHNAVDVSSPRLGIDGSRLILKPGRANPYYSSYLTRYLTSGDVVMLSGPFGTGLTSAGIHAVDCGGRLLSVGDRALFRVAACSHRLAGALVQP